MQASGTEYVEPTGEVGAEKFDHDQSAKLYKSDKHADLRRAGGVFVRVAGNGWLGGARAERGAVNQFLFANSDWRGSRTGECGRIRKAAREAESMNSTASRVMVLVQRADRRSLLPVKADMAVF